MIRTTVLRALRVVALALLLAPVAHAQEAAVVRRATELRPTPGDQGRSIAPLPAATAVTRTGERQGPWVQVRTAAGQAGWVHLFDIGPANAAPQATGVAGGALRGVTNLFGGTRSTQTATTAGIRGMDAADIAQAQPNPQAVTQMEALRQSENDARAFASGAALRPVAVAPLPAPARPPSGAAAAPSGNGQQAP